MMDIHSVAEDFYRAVRHLAMGTGGPRERLAYAYQDLVMAHNMRDQGALPPGFNRWFDEFHQRMTREQPNGSEGLIRATVRQMSD